MAAKTEKEIDAMIRSGGTMKKLIQQTEKKQKSLRTTFTLTREGNEALNSLKKDYKRKIKELIDVISREISQEKEQNGRSLIIASAEASKDKLDYEVRRSMVLSEKSLNILNSAAKEKDLPRDAILDRGFFIIHFLKKSDLKHTLQEHEKALPKFERLRKEALKIEREIGKTLDEEDPVLRRFSYAIIELENLITAIREEMKSGELIGDDLGFKVVGNG